MKISSIKNQELLSIKNFIQTIYLILIHLFLTFQYKPGGFMKVKLLVLSILFILLECALSPMGRKQVIIKDDAEMNAMGTEAFNEMKKTVPIETASNINNYVRCISFASLKHADDTTGVDAWEVVVFRDNNVNAFAFLVGKIGV